MLGRRRARGGATSGGLPLPPVEIPRTTWHAALKHGVHEKERVEPKGTKVVLGSINSAILRNGVVFARLLCNSVETLERLRNFHVPNKQELFDLAGSYDTGNGENEERWKLLSRALRSFGVRVDSGRKDVLIDGDSFEVASLLLDVLKAVAQIEAEVKSRAEEAAKKVEEDKRGGRRRRRRRRRSRTGERRGMMSEQRQQSLPQIPGRRQLDSSVMQQSQSYGDLYRSDGGGGRFRLSLRFSLCLSLSASPSVSPSVSPSISPSVSPSVSLSLPPSLPLSLRLSLSPSLPPSHTHNLYLDQTPAFATRSSTPQASYSKKRASYGKTKSVTRTVAAKGTVRVPRGVLQRLQSDRTLSMHNAGSPLELLVLAAVDAFRLAPKQAVALISGKNQQLAGILVNGEVMGTNTVFDLDRGQDLSSEVGLKMGRKRQRGAVGGIAPQIVRDNQTPCDKPWPRYCGRTRNS